MTLGDVKIEMPSTETNWASIAIAALDGKPIPESDKILLVAAGLFLTCVNTTSPDASLRPDPRPVLPDALLRSIPRTRALWAYSA